MDIMAVVLFFISGIFIVYMMFKLTTKKDDNKIKINNIDKINLKENDVLICHAVIDNVEDDKINYELKKVLNILKDKFKSENIIISPIKDGVKCINLEVYENNKKDITEAVKKIAKKYGIKESPTKNHRYIKEDGSIEELKTPEQFKDMLEDTFKGLSDCVANQQDCPGEYVEIVNENFWNLLDNTESYKKRVGNRFIDDDGNLGEVVSVYETCNHEVKELCIVNLNWWDKRMLNNIKTLDNIDNRYYTDIGTASNLTNMINIKKGNRFTTLISKDKFVEYNEKFIIGFTATSEPYLENGVHKVDVNYDNY